MQKRIQPCLARPGKQLRSKLPRLADSSERKSPPPAIARGGALPAGLTSASCCLYCVSHSSVGSYTSVESIEQNRPVASGACDGGPVATLDVDVLVRLARLDETRLDMLTLRYSVNISPVSSRPVIAPLAAACAAFRRQLILSCRLRA